MEVPYRKPRVAHSPFFAIIQTASFATIALILVGAALLKVVLPRDTSKAQVVSLHL